jgi:hypothetical protein
MMRPLLLSLAILLLACQAYLPASITNLGSVSAPHFPLAAALAPFAPASPPPLSAADFTIRYHPDGPLYVTDLVSLEVIAPPAIDLADREVKVEVLAPQPADFGSARFGPYGIAGRSQATFSWVWDTTSLSSGEYSLHFSVQPDGPDWLETVTLHPQDDLPPPEPRARWATAESECCLVHYITGTESARDLPVLLEIAAEQARLASRRMGGLEFSEPITITLLPRVLGHGGFAGREIYVSYLDRNYAGSDFAQVLHHEMVHILDGRLGGELRPSLLVEGLAVYLTRGHFKIEPLLPRAAALLELGWYLPLLPLSDDFYASQHEVGYLQAAALIQYMVNTWGWPAFSDFYRDIHPHPSGRHSDAIDAALQQHYGLTFAQLEHRFLAELHRLHLLPDMQADLRLSVLYYETVRRYQQALDPSAYFLTAWLPDGETMRERGLVADYLRRPQEPDNLALEQQLVQADAHLLAGDYQQAERLLVEINRTLAEIESHSPPPNTLQGLAAVVPLNIWSAYSVLLIFISGSIARKRLNH